MKENPIKKHLEELRTKTAESLASIASSFTDGGKAAEEFFTKFATNLGLTGKAIDEVLNKLKQFKQETQNAQQQLNNAGGNNTSPGNPLGGSTSNQNNNGGPLTGSPSNTSGATGTIGNNIIAAPQQSNSNNSSPNPNLIGNWAKWEDTHEVNLYIESTCVYQRWRSIAGSCSPAHLSARS